MTNYYDLLGVDPDAKKAEIKSAYREKVDAANESGDHGAAKDLVEAWNVLSDPYQRGRYDANIGSTGDDVEVVGDDIEVVDDGREPAPRPKGLMGRLLGAPPAPAGAKNDRRRAARELPELDLPKGLEPAPNGRRFMGVLLDGFAFYAIFVLTSELTLRVSGRPVPKKATSYVDLLGPWTALLFAVFFAFYLLFEIVPTKRRGQTVGRRLARVRVVDRETGEGPSWKQTFVRAMLPFVIFVVAFPVVGPTAGMVVLALVMWSALDAGRQGWHDKLAKTIVVDAGPPVPRGRKAAEAKR